MMTVFLSVVFAVKLEYTTENPARVIIKNSG